jgi:hypothetical protein
VRAAIVGVGAHADVAQHVIAQRIELAARLACSKRGRPRADEGCNQPAH